jgi:HAD superfamily hydrolase (TIGR01662 family)
MTTLFDAVLFDRDGTLIEDVPYNGNPDLVRPVPGARAALDRLRIAGLRVGVVSNQSGLATGRFTVADLDRVNARVEQLLGPFDVWRICPHGREHGCACRKPAPGLILSAAASLGVRPDQCVVVGDIGADMGAALAAGATGILVPTPLTRPEEAAEAPCIVSDLRAAAELILTRERLVSAEAPAVPRKRVLAVRGDSAGDVLLTGPAIRAVAAGAESLTLLCGPRGRAAAELLPGPDALLTWALPWIDPDPAAVDPVEMGRFIDRLADGGFDEAVVFTSFHQSPLPMALLLRMAGVPRISAISVDYPGSLLDVRHLVPDGIPEAERALSLAAAAGFPLPAGDEPVLRLRTVPPVPVELPAAPFVVVHPGASVAARACPPDTCAELVMALCTAGYPVVVTGGPDERPLTAKVASAGARRSGVGGGVAGAVDLGGQTSLAELAAIIGRAACVVVGNTGPAHIAAAMGTPVVSLFAPTVPFGQWAPHRVPAVRLGDATAPCRGSRAKECPVPNHPCLAGIAPDAVVSAVRTLAGGAP